MSGRPTVAHSYSVLWGKCGRDETDFAVGPLTWRHRVRCSWGLRVGLPPGSSRARRRHQGVGGRHSVLRPPGLGQGMERMEVDQCAGAAGGTGGGALRRSNSAPMITSVRSVLLHPDVRHRNPFFQFALIVFALNVFHPSRNVSFGTLTFGLLFFGLLFAASPWRKSQLL